MTERRAARVRVPARFHRGTNRPAQNFVPALRVREPVDADDLEENVENEFLGFPGPYPHGDRKALQLFAPVEKDGMALLPDEVYAINRDGVRLAHPLLPKTVLQSADPRESGGTRRFGIEVKDSGQGGNLTNREEAHPLDSQQDRLTQSLAEREERYRAFVAHSTEGIWRWEFKSPFPKGASPEEQFEYFFENA